MIGRVSSKYALRSLLRHPRRTILSILGVGVGCAIALIATSWVGGSTEMQIRAVAESGGGHLRVVPDGWTDTREDSLRINDWQETFDAVKSLPGVKSAALRARTNGLLAFGNRMSAARISGVEPQVEKTSNRLVYKGTIEGRYLQNDDKNRVVIGRTLAKRLDVEVDDDLYVTLAGREEIQSAMLRIVGILETGSKDLDATICHINLADFEEITGYDGPADISILLEHYSMIEPSIAALESLVPEPNTVITWKEVNPGLAGNAQGDQAFTRSLVVVIVLVVVLGIASAQLTAVLERRTEFAILCALGMKARQVVGLMVLEALIIGLGGAAIGLMVGGAVAHYLATTGVNLAALAGEELSFADVLLDPYMYGKFGPWLIWHSLGIALVSTTIASIYPAWLVTKLNPADSLRTV
ncbi:ABC transporter permease [Candidatus Hydrogenedentota bacterium]